MNLYICSAAALFLGILLDFIIGDPPGWYHPVQAIGALISKTEGWLRKLFPRTPKGERAAGGILVVLVAGCSTLVSLGLLLACYHVHILLGIGVEAVICGALLAAKSLRKESGNVRIALETEGVEAGRKAVSMIVGRDTDTLSEGSGSGSGGDCGGEYLGRSDCPHVLYGPVWRCGGIFL